MEFIRCSFTDIFGNLKNMAITQPAGKGVKQRVHVRRVCIEGFARIRRFDMYLYPDLGTWEIFSVAPQQARCGLICDVYRPNGQPFEEIALYFEKIVKKAKELGLYLRGRARVDFFLVNTMKMRCRRRSPMNRPAISNLEPMEFRRKCKAGYGADTGGNGV